MLGTIGPDVARAAVALRRSHPHAPALDVLDIVMKRRSGRLADFGDTIEPATPFGDLIAEAFDKGMAPEDWYLVKSPATPPAVLTILMNIWRTDVLPRLASRYSLAP